MAPMIAGLHAHQVFLKGFVEVNICGSPLPVTLEEEKKA
jgi:hypothetical protein